MDTTKLSLARITAIVATASVSLGVLNFLLLRLGLNPLWAGVTCIITTDLVVFLFRVLPKNPWLKKLSLPPARAFLCHVFYWCALTLLALAAQRWLL